MGVMALAGMSPWDWPADAGETLLGALHSAEEGRGERLLAAELAGNVTVMNDELAEALLAIVRDPKESEAMRATAAISLGPVLEELSWGDLDEGEESPLSERVARAIRDGLRDVYLDAGAPKDVRRRALEASVRFEEDWHPGAVRAAYYSGDDAWRLTAVFCMYYIGGFDHEIVEALGSGDPALRYEAVRAAGNWSVQEAWPQIRALVRSEGVEKPLLLAALEAAASMRPEEALDTFGHLLESEDPEIADAAFEALEMADALGDAPEDED